MAWIKRLLLLEPLWVLLLGIPILLPAKLIPQLYHPFLLAALFLAWPLRLLTTRRLSIPSPLLGSIYFILLWLPINIWASADRSTSWIASGYLLFGIALYSAAINWRPAQQKPQLVAWFLLLLGGGLALASPPIVAWKPQFRLFYLPLYDLIQSMPVDIGETIHANILAGVLVMVLPLFVILAAVPGWTARTWSRMVCGIVAAVIFVLLILTQSRGGYLGTMGALALLALLRWPRLRYFTPVAVVAIVTIIWRWGVEDILNILSNDSSLGGWAGRLDIWTQSWRALNDFLFTGIGIGTFMLVIPLLYPLRVNIEAFPHAHNLFLQIGVDLGLPSLLAYSLLLVNVFRMLTQLLRQRTNILTWTLAAGATASTVAMLIHGLFDAVTWGTKLAFIPWLLFALVTLLYHRRFQ